MKWRTYKEGDIRLRNKFAFFPMTDDESGTTYWLETVQLKERYTCIIGSDHEQFLNWQIVEVKELDRGITI